MRRTALDNIQSGRFQSTHPQGVRLPWYRKSFRPHLVSIHAPARGATSLPLNMPRSTVSFNPRTRKGCDPSTRAPLRLSCCFNPRTRKGCDKTPTTTPNKRCLFQSTHPQGVRLLFKLPLLPLKMFQSTHPQGVRLSGIRGYAATRYVSIHAPARGATFCIYAL